MKSISQAGATIVVDRQNFEGLLLRSVGDLYVSIIPLGIQLCRGAAEEESPGSSPQGSAASAIYFVINSELNAAGYIANELTRVEPKYKELIQFLIRERREGSLSPDVAANRYHELELTLNDWRIRLEKFIRGVDPDSHMLQVRHSFDPDVS